MRYVVGGLLAAVAMFIWGAVFWMSPLPMSVIGQSTDDAALGAAMTEHLPASGSYFVPGMGDDIETFNRLHAAGPVAVIHVDIDGSPAMDPKVFIKGFVHHLGVALLTAWLLAIALGPGSSGNPSLAGYWQRVGFVVLVGATASFAYDLGGTVWWPIGLDHGLITAAYNIVNWTIAGLILARVFRPEPAD